MAMLTKPSPQTRKNHRSMARFLLYFAVYCWFSPQSALLCHGSTTRLERMIFEPGAAEVKQGYGAFFERSLS